MLSGWVENTSEFFMAFGALGLFLVSFAESSFFPVPPDILLIGLSIHKPKLALWYALVTTLASVLGAAFGYLIGTKAGRPLLRRWVSPKRIGEIENLFARHGGWAVAIAGFTPIPYKVFTIASGLFEINRTVFLTASVLSRGARFFLEGILIFAIGARAKQFISNYFEIITVTVTLVVVVLYLVLRHTRLVIYLQQGWTTVKQKSHNFYSDRLMPLGQFGNYLVTSAVLGLGFLIVFAKLAEDVTHDEFITLDHVMINAIASLKSPLVTAIMTNVTTLGSFTVMTFVAIVGWLYLTVTRKRFMDAAMIIIVLAGAGVMNDLLKSAFQRSRPIGPMIDVTGFSFPSGHAMISLAFYGMLAYLIWVHSKSAKFKYVTTSLLSLLVLSIGLSRIYLGVHYPSDVIAGFAAGGFWLTGCILGLQAVRYYGYKC